MQTFKKWLQRTMVTCSEEKVCESDPGYFCGPKNHCGRVIYIAPKAIYSGVSMVIMGFVRINMIHNAA